MHRTTPAPVLLWLFLLVVPALARADDGDGFGPGRVFALEGGVAVPTGEYGDLYVGLAVPIRVGVAFQLTRLIWVEPFLSLAWVKPLSAQDLTPRSGFRILAGGELQLHSTPDRLAPFDVFGGLSVAFERVVAHSFIDGCPTCQPNASVTLSNGLDVGLRGGVLFRMTPDVRIGPYLGAQLSYMPNLAPLVTVFPAGTTSPVPLNSLQFWVEAGIRASISLN